MDAHSRPQPCPNRIPLSKIHAHIYKSIEVSPHLYDLSMKPMKSTTFLDKIDQRSFILTHRFSTRSSENKLEIKCTKQNRHILCALQYKIRLIHIPQHRIDGFNNFDLHIDVRVWWCGWRWCWYWCRRQTLDVPQHDVLQQVDKRVDPLSTDVTGKVI